MLPITPQCLWLENQNLESGTRLRLFFGEAMLSLAQGTSHRHATVLGQWFSSALVRIV